MIVEQLLDGCPDLLGLISKTPERFAALLQSASSGSAQARFDLLLIKDITSKALVKPSFINPFREGQEDAEYAQAFLDELDVRFKEIKIEFDASHDWPFVGGFFIYCGYELVEEIEPSLKLPQGRAPIAYLLRCRAAIVVDHLKKQCVLIQEDAGAVTAAEINQWRLMLTNPNSISQPVLSDLRFTEDPPQQYLTNVNRALEHIVAGNVYQANLARQWCAHSENPLSGIELYASLRQANPGPFAAYTRLGDFEVLSTSPERLFSVKGNRIDTRPIAGTRPRVGDEQAMRQELLNNPKEIAEHVMLVDLERNDLGKVCRAGSVIVDEWMSIESYAHVHHLVSNVTGQLNPNVTPGQIIKALFPGGTITGVPKVRCMGVIAELENHAREAYTGSLGYLSRDGQMDLNILIRTAWLLDAGTELSIRAGAGIVADSEPAKELNETRAKARGLLRGLGFVDESAT